MKYMFRKPDGKIDWDALVGLTFLLVALALLVISR